MTDPPQTARDSATSARSKTYHLRRFDDEALIRDIVAPYLTEERPYSRAEIDATREAEGFPKIDWPDPLLPSLNPDLIGDIQRGPQPVTEVPAVAWPSIPRPTLHGIGWLVNLIVGLVTLWVVAHGGHL